MRGRHVDMSFGTTPWGEIWASANRRASGLKLWAIKFLCPSERSDEAAPGLTFGPRIEDAAPKKWQSSSSQVGKN